MGSNEAGASVCGRSPSGISPYLRYWLTRGAPPPKDEKSQTDRHTPRPRSPLGYDHDDNDSDDYDDSLPRSRTQSTERWASDDRQEAQACTNPSLPDHVCTDSWRTNCHYCVQTKLLCDLRWEITRVSAKAAEAERKQDSKVIRRLLVRLDELSLRLERVLDRSDSSEYSIMLEKVPQLPPLPPMDEEGFWMF